MQPSKLLSLYCAAASCAVMMAPAASALSPDSAAMATSVPINPMTKFYGHAASSSFDQHVQSGMEALDQRVYGQAEAQLSAASAALRQHNITDDRWWHTRLALGQALLGEEKLEAAEKVLSDVAARARGQNGNGHIHESALAALAETLRLLGDLKRAQATCEQAINEASQSHNADARELSRVYATQAEVMAAQGLDKSAISLLRQALKLAQSEPDNAHDGAEISYKLAVQLHNSGETEEAADLFHHAFAELDGEARFHAPLYAAPRLNVHWEPGSPRCRLIADNEYPLKYVLVGNLRVAATAVRSENVIAVLISLANCGRSRIQLAVGPTRFEQIRPKRKDFLYVPNHQLDVTLEEEHVTELTWRRRWLNHIEKTRYIPGYLKNSALDLDNFFGNNQFGEYGNWPVIANDETPIVTREEFLYGKKRQPDISTINFLSRGSTGYRPTYIDPGEAKTGLVFFKQERFDEAQLDINIGNTMIEIPIDSAGPR